MNDFIKILDINITTLKEDSILEKIEKYVIKSKIQNPKSKKGGQKPLVIYTPNPEIIMYARSHQWFKEVVNKGQFNIPDGAGVVWAAKRKGQPIERRIAGVDLAYKLVRLASKENVVVGLIGGFDKIALSALECLKQDFPSLKGWVEEGPQIKFQNPKSKYQIDYGNWDINDFIKRVEVRKTKILLVAFGFPKQEMFINQIAQELDNIVIMAVGGTFNFWAGKIKRAPVWMKENNIEWLYRLIKEPVRIKRQIEAALFFWKVYIS